jgi:putative ABC transport system permease protein
MNMMLVSVTERIHEIGLRKSLGARRRDILIQFLFETLVLCLVSGFVGICAGLSFGYVLSQGVIYFVPMLSEWPWEINPMAVSIAFLCSTLVGLGSGIYPAWKAACLDPTVALRHE